MDRLVLETAAWQTARIVSACVLSFLFARAAALQEWYWALITAVVVMQPVFKETMTASRNRIFGTLLGAAVGFVVLEVAKLGLPLFPLFWCGLVPLAVITAFYPTWRLSIITLAVVVLIPSNGPAFERPLDRVLGILVGVGASVLVSAMFRWRENVKA